MTPKTTSTIVKVDDDGRLTIPKAIREVLGIDGQNARVELDIEVVSDGE